MDKKWLWLLLLAALLLGCGAQGEEPVTVPATVSVTVDTTVQTVPTTHPEETTAAVLPATTAPDPTETTTDPTEATTLPAPTTGATLPEETTAATEETTAATGETVDPGALEQESQALSQTTTPAVSAVTVEAPGIRTQSAEGCVIDYSNTDLGYVMVKLEEPVEQRFKVRIQGPATAYTYNLTYGSWTAFPLSDGNGSYQITVYRNVTGTKYATVLALGVQVAQEDEFTPFLRSNQYVDFDNAPQTVAKAAALTGQFSAPLEKVQAVYDYVVKNLTYDYALAATVTSGYLPVLDQVLQKGSGICFDYAALMTGMLRSQGIPTKLIVGYAGDVYHAWISVWTEQTGWVDGVIYFDGRMWKRMDPTFASTGGAAMLDFIGNNANYTTKYVY